MSGARHLEGAVARRDARPAGRDQDARVVRRHLPLDPGADLGRLVAHDGLAGDDVAGRFEQGHDRRAARVGGLGAGVADRQHRAADGRGRLGAVFGVAHAGRADPRRIGPCAQLIASRSHDGRGDARTRQAAPSAAPTAAPRCTGRSARPAGRPIKPLDPPVRHFIGEFAQELFDVDSRVLRSLRRLFFSPGFLTREHVAGRRVALGLAAQAVSARPASRASPSSRSTGDERRRAAHGDRRSERRQRLRGRTGTRSRKTCERRPTPRRSPGCRG